jgi:hypothetical protein
LPQNFIAPWVGQGLRNAMKLVGLHDGANAHKDDIIRYDAGPARNRSWKPCPRRK